MSDSVYAHTVQLDQMALKCKSASTTNIVAVLASIYTYMLIHEVRVFIRFRGKLRYSVACFSLLMYRL